MLADIIIAAAVLVPAGLAVLAMVPGQKRLVSRLAIAAPLPALLAAGLPRAADIPVDVVHLGLFLGIDAHGPVFLLAIALVWMAAAWQAALDRTLIDGPGGRVFLGSLMGALCGAAGAALALEPTGFYLFFTIMTLSAYGLIVSAGAKALWAGRLFIVLALCGEMAMLAGFMLAAAPPVPGIAVALLFYFGMGTKHAVLPLHAWLPPAHGAAPPQASALLSGPILNTGVLAWLRFMPLAGDAGMAALLPLMAGGGLLAAFMGAVAGVMQYKPKVVLAYSSVSQMGILTAAAAYAVVAPAESPVEPWGMVLPVLGLFAFHHAVTKGALFLSVQVRRDGPMGRWVFPVQVLLGLSISGFALSSGALVKLWLDHAAPHDTGIPWLAAVTALLPFAAVGSTLLVARFLWLVRPGTPPAVDHLTGPAPALALAGAALVGSWAVAYVIGAPVAEALAPGAMAKAVWPVLLGLGVAASALVIGRRAGWRLRQVIPNGDIAVWLPWLAGFAARRMAAPHSGTVRPAAIRGGVARAWSRWLDRLERGDAALTSMAALGVGGLLVALALAIAFSAPA